VRTAAPRVSALATGDSGPDSAGTDKAATLLNRRADTSNDANGPMHGTILAAAPMDALKFQVDQNAATYLARAMVSVVVRNAQNDAVWSGQKEIYVHGPLREMDQRRSGNLVFQRQITVPAGEGFTIDAKVEDLLAGTRGHTETPLRRAPGAPGLMASDALFVRPFQRAVDKFEADQMFRYQGTELSPLLNPVFRAGSDLRLQLFLTIYPDLQGAKPEMSLEIARDGHSVVRMPMQLSTNLADASRDSEHVELAPGIPYLADIKGAKLAPGNYEAIVSIRQAHSSITRNVPFHVTGEPAVAAAPATQPDLHGDAADGAVVMPEIEPATI